jgi:hypothetical protein
MLINSDARPGIVAGLDGGPTTTRLTQPPASSRGEAAEQLNS